MTNPIRRTQYKPGTPVNWPVLYRGDDFMAEGTVLDLSPLGWRVAGPMPVVPGMQLTLQLWVPDKPEPVRIERATVLWVKDCEFAIEGGDMGFVDRAWVTTFLHRKHEAAEKSREIDRQPSVPAGIEDHVNLATGSEFKLPRCEDIMRLFGSPKANTKLVKQVVMEWAKTEQHCTEEQAQAVYDRFLRDVWQPARRIYNGIVARQAQRDATGEDAIANN